MSGKPLDRPATTDDSRAWELLGRTRVLLQRHLNWYEGQWQPTAAQEAALIDDTRQVLEAMDALHTDLYRLDLEKKE